MSMYDRAFGIEFEMGARGLRSRGNSRFEELREILEFNGLRNFVVGYDGTEFEVKTPPLRGANGWKTIKKFLSVISSDVVRGYVTDSDGLHVHHDAPEFVDNNNLTLRLVENWIANQNIALKMVHPRRVFSGHCPQWNNFDYADLERALQNQNGYSYGTRKNLNIRAIHRHGTIEFRCHEGTLDYDEILSWVRFGQAFIHSTLSGEEFSSADVSTLLKNVRVSRFANRFLPKKAERMARITNYRTAW